MKILLIPNEYIEDLFEKHQQGQILNANELASLLLRICGYEEDQDGQSLILTLNDQILQLTPPPPLLLLHLHQVNNY